MSHDRIVGQDRVKVRFKKVHMVSVDVVMERLHFLPTSAECPTALSVCLYADRNDLTKNHYKYVGDPIKFKLREFYTMWTTHTVTHTHIPT